MVFRSKPLLIGRELAPGQELAMASSFDTSSLSASLVRVCVEIIVMNVLRGVFSMCCICHYIEASVRNVFPSSFRFIGKQDVRPVHPPQPRGHSLSQVPSLLAIRVLMHPVVQRALILMEHCE